MRRTNVKYGRRASVDFSVDYVVCVSRSRIGLCVIYVHVESIGFLRVIWSMRTGILSRTAHAPFGENIIYVGSQYN